MTRRNFRLWGALGTGLLVSVSSAQAGISITVTGSYSPDLVIGSSNANAPLGAVQNSSGTGISYGSGALFTASEDFFLGSIDLPLYTAAPSQYQGAEVQISIFTVSSLSDSTVNSVLYRESGLLPNDLSALSSDFVVVNFDLSDSAAALQLSSGQSYGYLFEVLTADDSRTQSINSPVNFVTSFSSIAIGRFPPDADPESYTVYGSKGVFGLASGTYSAVPEPEQWTLGLGLGALFGLLIWRRRGR
jgi:hypothetical protein